MKHFFINNSLKSFLLAIAFSGCANLHTVNNFSSASSSALSKFEDIDYGFNQHCRERCVAENISEFQIKRTPDCNCAIYKTADSVTTLIYLSVKNYFASLAALSGKDQRHYDFTSLNASLVAGSFGDFQITQQQADAYSGVANLLLDASTGIYRNNKIRKYVQQANRPMQLLLEKLQFILQENLSGELDFKKEKLYNLYRGLLLTNGLNNFEKQKATEEYYEQLEKINSEQDRINLFATSLADIASGHQKIFENLNEMKDKPLKDSLLILQTHLQSNILRFNKIKN